MTMASSRLMNAPCALLPLLLKQGLPGHPKTSCKIAGPLGCVPNSQELSMSKGKNQQAYWDKPLELGYLP